MSNNITKKQIKDLQIFIEDIINGLDPITKKNLSKDSPINTLEWVRNFYILEKILKDYNITNKKSITEINKKDYILDHGISLSSFLNSFKYDYMTLDKKNIEPEVILELLYKNNCLDIDQTGKKYKTRKGYNLGFYVKPNSITLSSNAQEVLLKLLCNEEVFYNEEDYPYDYFDEENYL